MSQDRTLTCRDCSAEFVFTAGEQEFYASKGLQNDPVRCPDCRNARKSARTTLENETGYIRYGGAASFGGRTPRQMHPAACALCGDMIEVPFIPRGDRPVFCSTVKRLLTQGYELDAVAREWGQRPCQNDAVRDVLRSGVPGPYATTDGSPAPTANGIPLPPTPEAVAAAAAALIGDVPLKTDEAAPETGAESTTEAPTETTTEAVTETPAESPSTGGNGATAGDT